MGIMGRWDHPRMGQLKPKDGTTTGLHHECDSWYCLVKPLAAHARKSSNLPQMPCWSGTLIQMLSPENARKGREAEPDRRPTWWAHWVPHSWHPSCAFWSTSACCQFPRENHWKPQRDDANGKSLVSFFFPGPHLTPKKKYPDYHSLAYINML